MSSARTPQRDRAPDALAAGTPPGLRDDLVALFGADCVLTRPIDLIRFATDASCELSVGCPSGSGRGS